jgi:uncharacterized peroxidase-related enzyme
VFIDVIADTEATGELRAYYDRQRAAWGFLPNYALAFATRPDIAAAWDQLNGAVRGGMDRRRFEIATVAAARAMRSTYCATAHAKFLRDVCGDSSSLEAIVADPSGGTLEPADQAVYEFAGRVATDAASVTQTDVDRLKAVGLTDSDVADVVFAAAARAFFTRVLDGLGAQLDAQTAAAFPPDQLSAFVVGREPASQASE